MTDTRSELGLRADKSFAMTNAILTLRGRAAWAHDFGPDLAIGATFQALPGASFVVSIARADAIRYALTRWDTLCRFLDDGRIELDTNTVERAIRPITLGRKNHLFAGSDGGADRWTLTDRTAK